MEAQNPKKYHLRRSDTWQKLDLERTTMKRLIELARYRDSYNDVIVRLLDERMLAKEK